MSRASSPSSPLTIIITTLRKNLWKSCLSSRGLDGFGGGILKRAFHSSWYMLYKWGKDLPALNLPSHLAGIYLIERLGVGVALVEGTSLPGPWVAFGVCSPEVYHSFTAKAINYCYYACLPTIQRSCHSSINDNPKDRGFRRPDLGRWLCWQAKTHLACTLLQ